MQNATKSAISLSFLLIVIQLPIAQK